MAENGSHLHGLIEKSGISVCKTEKSAAVLTQIARESGITVSKRTVQRRLAEEGLTGHRPVKKPRLTEAMKKKRLAWAREHRLKTIEDWNTVSFRVKITFCL